MLSRGKAERPDPVIAAVPVSRCPHATLSNGDTRIPNGELASFLLCYGTSNRTWVDFPSRRVRLAGSQAWRSATRPIRLPEPASTDQLRHNNKKSELLVMANALVLASGFFLQYRTLRCAAKLFSAVYVLGERRAKPMRASIACDGFFDSDHEFYLILRETVDQINSLCRTLKIDIILPSDASTTRFISRYRDQLHAAVYPVPSRNRSTL